MNERTRLSKQATTPLHLDDTDHDDDEPRGILLSRKEALAVMAGVGTAVLVGGRPVRAESAVTEPKVCVALPEMTDGPFYLDKMLERSDIRLEPSDGSVRPGIPLDLVFDVSRLVDSTCVPLEGAIVDVWHCDALGVYSGVQDRNGNSTAQTFLRGYQQTDPGGLAHFVTIYPGWYRGRAVHIHFKIRSTSDAAQAFEFTSQLFFDDGLSDMVHATEAYAANGQRGTRNAQDGIFQGGGDQLTLDVSKTDEGYAAVFAIAIDTDRAPNR